MQGLLINLFTKNYILNLSLKKQTQKLILFVGISFSLVSCGGGGGGPVPDAAPPDTTGPKVVVIKPANNEIDVLFEISQLSVTFDEALNEESIIPANVVIQELDVNGSVIPNSSVSLINSNPLNYIVLTNKLIITTVAGSFKENLDYQIEIKNFVDKLGNPMVTYKSKFSTTKAPTVVKLTPFDNAIPVSIAQKITIEFDEVMDDASLKSGFTLIESIANSTVSTTFNFTASNSPLKLVHKITGTKSTATYSLVEPTTRLSKLLAKAAHYTINLSSTVTDLKGNSLAPVSSAFTTGVSDQTGTPATKPGAVTVSTSGVTGGTLDNNISWPALANTAYYLYVSIDGSLLSPVATTPSPLFNSPFVDKNVTVGAKYVYAVSAVNIISTDVYGSESEFSKSNPIVVGVSAPLSLIATAGPDSTGTIADGVVTLVWDSIVDYKYNLFVSINGASYSALQSNIIATSTQLSHSYTPGNDIKYKYAVTAVNVKNIESVKTQSDIVVPFGAPTTVTAVGGDKQVSVSWQTWNNVPGLTYSVFVKKGNAAFSTTAIATGITTGNFIHGSGAAGSNNAPLLNGNSYTYRVLAVSTVSGVSRTSQGKNSNVALTVTPPPPPAVPAGFNASAADSSVTFNWTIASGAKGSKLNYRIYKKLINDTSYSLVTELIKPAVGTVKIVAANNISYLYQITAVDTGVEGMPATTIAITPRLTGSKISAWNHSCVIKAGKLWCWGENNYGQLGNGLKTFAEKQQLVKDPVVAGAIVGTSWITVSTGSAHTCGIRNTGDLFCWGDGRNGQLGIGDGTNTQPTVPTITPQLVSKPAILPVTQKPNWIQITAGSYFTCGIIASTADPGQLFCWGNNSYGQLGVTPISTALTMQPEPVDLGADLINNWVEIRAGKSHTCGIRQQTAGSSLWCWGDRTSGKLGDNNPADTTTQNLSIPGQVVSTGGGIMPDLDWSSLAVGASHTCAIRGTLNTLWCWGHNNSGQLGSADRAVRFNSFAPIQVLPPTQNWLKVFANNEQTCALRTTGETNCWGKNYSGEAGLGFLSYGESVPVNVGGSNWTELAIGLDHACAINNSSNVSCWGNAEKFGNGTVTSESFVPAQVGTATDWIDISAGSGVKVGQGISFTLGLRTINTNKTLYAWGENNRGNLAAAKNLLKEQAPLVSSSIFSWNKISAGASHSCGIKSDNTLYCWGEYLYLGSSTSSSSTPVQVGTATWQDVDAGFRHSCGIKLADSSLWCWGKGTYGELGAGADSKGVIIVPDTANGIYLVKVKDPVGKVSTQWASVSVGSQYTCAIDVSSVLYCWGRNGKGQLGDGSIVNKNVPTKVTNPVGVTTLNWSKVSAADSSTCALTDKTSQNLYCWGNNSTGQLGIGSNANKTQATAVTFIDGISWLDVVINNFHACAIKKDSTGGTIGEGSLWCWGSNNFGQVGNGSFLSSTLGQTTPAKVTGAQMWKKVTNGYDSTCAIRADNSLWCWGRNFDGQLGTNNAWKTRPSTLTFP